MLYLPRLMVLSGGALTVLWLICLMSLIVPPLGSLALSSADIAFSVFFGDSQTQSNKTMHARKVRYPGQREAGKPIEAIEQFHHTAPMKKPFATPRAGHNSLADVYVIRTGFWSSVR